MNAAIGYTAITVVALASALIGFYGLRVSRTTSDFYVASRTVRPWWNASAIGGEYLSAGVVPRHRRAHPADRARRRCGSRSATPPGT